MQAALPRRHASSSTSREKVRVDFRFLSLLLCFSRSKRERGSVEEITAATQNETVERDSPCFGKLNARKNWLGNRKNETKKITPTQFARRRKKHQSLPAFLSLSCLSLFLFIFPMAGDNRCVNRVITGVGVGGALGASIGEEEKKRERKKDGVGGDCSNT